MTDFDVIILGYGPTGKLLAALLSDAGHRVAVVDRWSTSFPLPRAIAYYHDAKRMFTSLGLMDRIARVSRPFDHYTWFNADWEVLVDFDHGTDSPSGGPGGYTFSQPDLEDIFDAELRGRDNIAFYTGFEAQSVAQDAGCASVVLRPFDTQTETATGDEIRLSARYLVGSDGANSLVREAIGSGQEDLGFNADWMVVDVEPLSPEGLDVPDSAQWCNPARPTTIVPCGTKLRRWEVMMHPGENPEAFMSDENVWALLSRWVTPQTGRLVRKALYHFQSLIAESWRSGRLLLAGDAAHLMPPFMGQGMGSGLRDAWGLAWELDLVLRGVSTPDLLDEYQRERADHVRQYIDLSMEMGQVVCMTDPEAVARRDRDMKRGEMPLQDHTPTITGGVIAREGGAPAPGAGLFLPHVELEGPDGTRRALDAITGRRVVLLTWGARPLDPAAQAVLDRVGGVVLPLGPGFYRDTEGRLEAFFDAHRAVALIARPDFHSFAVARASDDLSGLVRDLGQRLHLSAVTATIEQEKTA